MNVFISEMLKTMGIAADSQKLNCCKAQGTIIDDSKVGFSLTLPDGTTVEVYTPKEDSGAAEEGFAYIPECDAESPDMCAEDLGTWVGDCLDCSRRIDAYYESIRGRNTELNSALEPDTARRIKDVFRAAQSAVDLPPGFRYTAFRENKEADLILSTLMYTSQKVGTQWVAKSSLALDVGAGVDERGSDDWTFEPNYNPDSEAHLIYHRAGRFIDVERGAYGDTVTGDTAEKRDKQAAYWLAGLLSDMVDSMLQNPPARCYEFFLADGIAELKKSDLDRMSTPGIMRLVTKGYIKAENVLRAKPALAKDLVQKKLITPEIVARRVPERLLWLVQAGYISPDYAVKVDPAIKDQLVKKGLYTVAENIPDDPAAILEGVKSGEIQPVDAYRKNAKLLQPMVEQKLITPQEAYKLDASIVTWLLLNRYIGREEAQKVKPDIQKYIARKYKDVNWEELDASCSDGEKNLNAGTDGAQFKDKLKKLKESFAKRQRSAKKAEEGIDAANEAILGKAAKLREAAGLNSSMGFNSNMIGDGDNVGEPLSSSETPHIFEEGDFSQYAPGYEPLADTTAEGPGFVAEVMLPEDNFDGIVIPGDSADIAKETLTQMLLANDGTFIDWKPVTDIQTFKAENATGNYLVLN